MSSALKHTVILQSKLRYCVPRYLRYTYSKVYVDEWQGTAVFCSLWRTLQLLFFNIKVIWLSPDLPLVPQLVVIIRLKCTSWLLCLCSPVVSWPDSSAISIGLEVYTWHWLYATKNTADIALGLLLGRYDIVLYTDFHCYLAVRSSRHLLNGSILSFFWLLAVLISWLFLRNDWLFISMTLRDWLYFGLKWDGVGLGISQMSNTSSDGRLTVQPVLLICVLFRFSFFSSFFFALFFCINWK